MRRTFLILSTVSALAFAGAAAAQTAPTGGTDTAVPSGPATPPTDTAVNPPAGQEPTSPMPEQTPAAPASGTDTSSIQPTPQAPTPGAPVNDPGMASASAPNQTPTSAAATSASTGGFLARGMMVRDASGANLGRIRRIDTTGGQTQAVIRMGGRDVMVPVSSLHTEGRGAVSAQSRADLQGAAAPAQ